MQIFSHKKDSGSTNTDIVEQIVLEKYNQYYRLAYSYVRNEADAYDIVQNGAYRALRGSHTLKQKEHAETWVYRIMLNECFRYLEQLRKNPHESIPEQAGTEMECAEDHCGKIDLQRALDSLQEQDKAVIILRYFEDRKLDEIAEILAENVNTVKSRLYRGMKKLRNILEAGI